MLIGLTIWLAEQTMNREQVVADLADLGFFNFVPALHLEHARRKTLAALTERSLDFGFDWDPDHLIQSPWHGERYFHADAEELAEGGVASFVRKLIPLLARESVFVDFLADHQDWNAESGRTTYEILVNEDRHFVYQFDLNDEPDLWNASHRRTIEILNDLLERAGSQEHAFGAASGNDAGIYILTTALYEYIRQLQLDPVYRPVPVAELANDVA